MTQSLAEEGGVKGKRGILLMTKKREIFAALAFLCGFLLSGAAYGFETQGQDCSKCHTLNRDEAQSLLKEIYPDLKVLAINHSPAKSVWEVYLESRGRAGIVYVDFSKKFVFSGSLISIAERKNLSQDRISQLRRFDVSQIPLGDALVMGDEKAPIRVVVFDDPD
jgi:thiol:disulfide interchange protein DsbC